MSKRLVCLSAVLTLVFVPSFGSQSGLNSRNAVQSRSVGRVNHAAIAGWSRMKKSPSVAPTNIGFLSSNPTAAGGGTFPNYPAVTGDFTGSGVKNEVAAIVNTSSSSVPAYSIAVDISDGKGNFHTVLTPTQALESDAIFAGDLNNDGKDDILIVHPAAAQSNTLIQGWTSKGDGTFTAQGGAPMGVTTNGFVWATLADVNGDGNLDVVLADAASPSGNIWTALGNGDGTFKTATSVPFIGALAPRILGVTGKAGTQGNPGNPMVFADFNGDGFLDFAAPAATTNQIMVYFNDKTGHYPAAPTPLATPDGNFNSCFLTGGALKTGGAFGELVSANCDSNNVTVYVNDGTGKFTSQPYIAVGSDPVAVTVADVNGDGDTDIVASCVRSADIKILLGNGTGAVQPASAGYVTGGSPLVPPLVADFNGDGKADVVLPDDEFSFVYLQGYGDGSFRSAVNYYSEPGSGAGAAAVNIASGDFNGDGIPDFVIGNARIGGSSQPNYSITVFLSNADGTLKPGVNYSNPAFPNTYSLQYVAVADFNGDGKLDIAATDNFNGVVQIFTGKGDGTFTPGATYPSDTATGANPVGLVVGDFNGDGKTDLAVVNNHAGATADVGVLINDGNGGFKSVVNYPLSTLATEITAADVNGDKKQDLVVPLYGICVAAPGSCPAPGSAVAILLGNGDGTFKPESDVSLTNGTDTYLDPYYAAVSDVNGDGKLDLVVTIEDQKNLHQGIAVALGNGDGTFQTQKLMPTTLQNPLQDVPLPGYVKIVDFNRDGVPDLVYSNSQFSTVGILYGKGGGAFYDPVEFPANRWAWGLAVVDLNGDGGSDVVVSGNSFDFSGVAVLFNSGGNKATLTSSAPQTTPGASVTFTATVSSDVKGVSAIPSGNVTFNDGSTALGSAPLSSAGVATLSTTALLAAGPHSITAQYGGDVNFVPHTSSPLNQVVVVPSFSLTSTPASQTVNPGTSATYTITQGIAYGYDGAVSFPATACSGLPSGTTCSFSPSSITGSGSTTLTITTIGPHAGLIAPPALIPHKGGLNLWASLGGFGLVGVVLAGDWRSRTRRRMGIVLAVLAVMLLITLVGCGGSSSSTPGTTGGTAAGSYTVQVTVTGTAGSNHGSTSPSNGPLKLTLVVN